MNEIHESELIEIESEGFGERELEAREARITKELRAIVEATIAWRAAHKLSSKATADHYFKRGDISDAECRALLNDTKAKAKKMYDLLDKYQAN